MSAHHNNSHIYTIQEQSQQQIMNNNNNNNEIRASSGQIDQCLIDTSGIPLTTSQNVSFAHHQHQQPIEPELTASGIQLDPNANNTKLIQQQYELSNNSSPSSCVISNQPGPSSGCRVAPEQQNVVYSVHPIFNLLDGHDVLLVRQRAEPESTCCGFETVNSYTVRAKDGTPVFKALENSNCCERCCFEGNREFNLTLVHEEETIARIRKPYRVSRFCCYSSSVFIESPEDNPIGYIRQQFSFFGHARYAIFDNQQSAKKPTFVLESTSCRFCLNPLLCICLCPNNKFRILSVETRELAATIWRHWNERDPTQLDGGGTVNHAHQASHEQEMKTMTNVVDPNIGNMDSQDQDQDQDQQAASDHLQNDPNHDSQSQGLIADQDQNQGSKQKNNRKKKELASGGSSAQFGIQFEPNLEARQKVLLLSACFMMDFFYFENDRRKRKLTSC